MKKSVFILSLLLLTFSFTSCSSDEGFVKSRNLSSKTQAISDSISLVKVKNSFSKMQITGDLHNRTMSSVYNKIKFQNNLIPTDDYEVMLDSFAKIAKYSFDYECDKTTKSTMHTQYKYFLDSENFYNKIVAHRDITYKGNDVESILINMNKATNSEYIKLDSFINLDEMLYALYDKKIISSKASVIFENIHNLICMFSDGRISDAEIQKQIDNTWIDFDTAKFDENSYEGACIAGVLYVAQASFEWWKENQNGQPQLAYWVALDTAGALVGGLFYCFKHWDDLIVWEDLALDCAESAVLTSLGGIIKK